MNRYFRNTAGLDLAFLELVLDEAHDLPYVLLHPSVRVGDDLWAFGHPDGMFRAGQPATLVYEGISRRSATDDLPLLRVHGTPLGAGHSGSAVVNRRTGAVCGMLCTSDTMGSAHLLPTSEIIARCDAARLQLAGPEIAHQDWLRSLTDVQLRAGGWQFPGPELRAYLKAAARAARLHPYPGVITGNAAPPLSTVYVQQLARAEWNAEADGVREVAAVRPAAVVFDDRDSQFVVLEGTAGAGKSSLLRAAITALVERWERGAETVVPVRVLAADLVPPRPLPEAVAASVNADLSALGLWQSWPPEFFRNAPVSGGQWLVLVDGLDEVMDVEQRRSVVAKMAGASTGEPNPGYRFIVATRPLPEGEPPIQLGEGSLRYELLPFTDGQAVAFAEKWFGQLGVQDPEVAALRFAKQLEQTGLDELARTPLMATMLCQIFAANPDAALPSGRTMVYRAFIDLLYERQYGDLSGGIYQQVKKVLAPYGQVAEESGARLLAYSIEAIQRLASVRQDGSTEPAGELLSQWTADLRPVHITASTWHTLVCEVARRSGVLIERSGDFAFLHQTIEEYLAARYVAADPRRSDEEFDALFGPAPRQAAALSSVWRQSYARFLVAEWLDRADMAPALLRLADRGEPSGARFIASLVADGVRINRDIVLRALDCLELAATDHTISELDRQSAVEAVIQLDPGRGSGLAITLARDRALDREYRRWAICALAGINHHRAGLATGRFSIGEYRRSLDILARGGAGPEGVDLLADLVEDLTLEEFERRLSAQALARAGSARGRDLAAHLAEDARLDAAERRWTAAVLVSAEDPRGAEIMAGLAADATVPAADRELAAQAVAGPPSNKRPQRNRFVAWRVPLPALSAFRPPGEPSPTPTRLVDTNREVYTGRGVAPTQSVGAVDGAGLGAFRRRIRAQMARRIARQRPSGALWPVLQPLVATHRAAHPKADMRELQRAYDLADERHRGQLRKSGAPYITHPLAVATILAEMGMDTTTLVAALLSDTVEETGLTRDEIEAEFGAEVAHLVDGVTKLDKVKYGEAAEAETIRKMIVAMARDPRVLVIELADRLHDMRTLRFLPPHKQEQKARETLEVLAPLAYRLGMNTIKRELEDLGFATLYPKMYDEIVKLVAERAPERDVYLDQCVNVVGAELRAARVKATVSGRPKHYYSIYQKMIVQGREFTDIYDLIDIRVLVETVRDCYAALGVIHATWPPVPGRIKDYIAMPKFNMYQSLHTTVIGPGGKPVELQIRSYAMHRTAEYGIAAHWKYKDQKDAPLSGPMVQDEMAWLRQLLDWQREAQEPGDFLDSLRFDLAAREVFVFTPKGDVIPLPAGSTPVDFAYAIHTDVGHRCIGARVNKNLVALESRLENGDTVEILTSRSESAGPSQDWLAFVKSPRAKNKIRQWFSKERREDAIEAGKEAISRVVRKQGLPLQRLLGGDALATLAKDMRLYDVSALYAAVGENQVSATAVVHRLMAALGGLEGAAEDIAETAIPTRSHRRISGDPGVVVQGTSDVWVKLAKCCTPVVGDEILGFVTRGGGVSVHRKSCTNAASLMQQSERLVDVAWRPSTDSVFLVAIQVEALDRHRLLSDITRVLSDERVNILSATVTTNRERVAINRFTFELGDPMHLGHVLRTIRGVDGVYDVYRVSSAS